MNPSFILGRNLQTDDIYNHYRLLNEQHREENIKELLEGVIMCKQKIPDFALRQIECYQSILEYDPNFIQKYFCLAGEEKQLLNSAVAHSPLLARWLMEHGAVQEADQKGNLALHVAIMNNIDLETISTLLDDTKMDVANDDGLTPFHLIILHHRLDVLPLISDKKMNLKQTPAGYIDLFHMAILSNAPKQIFEFLLQHKILPKKRTLDLPEARTCDNFLDVYDKFDDKKNTCGLS